MVSILLEIWDFRKLLRSHTVFQKDNKQSFVCTAIENHNIVKRHGLVFIEAAVEV